MLIDSHCHLDYLTGPERGMRIDEILDSAAEAGVGRMLTVSVDRDNLPKVLEHASRFDNVFASVGIHPLSCALPLVSEDELLAWAAKPKVIAIGETGLDYYYGTENAALQRESFATHLRVAARAGLPVIVHSRDARDDTLSLLREHASREHAGVMHCFTESAQMALAAIELNFLISFSGIITFRNAEALREVVRQVPLECMLVETDSPYLAPAPHRGRTNQPCHVVHVARAVADIKGVPLERVEEITTANFARLFPRSVTPQ